MIVKGRIGLCDFMIYNNVTIKKHFITKQNSFCGKQRRRHSTL